MGGPPSFDSPPSTSPTSPTSRPRRKRRLPDSFQISSRPEKAKRTQRSAAANKEEKRHDTCEDEDEDEDGGHVGEMEKKGKKKRITKAEKRPPEEKRSRRFRPKPPTSFGIIYDRATSQRFYVLSRSRSGTPECPEETVEMTGSTGNIYHVHVARVPTCTCPHSQKGSQCKHLIYVMSRVLRARFELVYQLALLASELREIFDHAPSIRVGGVDVDDGTTEGGEREDEKNRKSIEGDCPICFTPFEDPDDTVYCRAQCGQNMHKECFEMWAATKRKSPRDKVTCPFCRTPWQGDDDVVKKIQNTGIVGDEGYVNIADQLGVSRHRGMPNNIYLLMIFPWLLTSSCRWQHLL